MAPRAARHGRSRRARARLAYPAVGVPGLGSLRRGRHRNGRRRPAPRGRRWRRHRRLAEPDDGVLGAAAVAVGGLGRALGIGHRHGGLDADRTLDDVGILRGVAQSRAHEHGGGLARGLGITGGGHGSIPWLEGRTAAGMQARPVGMTTRQTSAWGREDQPPFLSSAESAWPEACRRARVRRERYQGTYAWRWPAAPATVRRAGAVAPAGAGQWATGRGARALPAPTYSTVRLDRAAARISSPVRVSKTFLR